MYRLQSGGWLLFLLAASLDFPICAQVRSATISGQVTDASGSAIPGVKVTITDQATNQQYEAVTNAAGIYSTPYLPAARYTVAVSHEGFAPYIEKNIPLGTAQNIRLDVRLVLRSVQSEISVVASAAQLQTESSSVGNAIDASAIEALPNINHNPYSFVTLQQGMTPRLAFLDTTGVNSFGIGIEGRRQFSAFSANGGQAFSNDIQVDGLSVQGSAWNEAAVLPNADGIQEVRTNVNNFSAEYGRGQAVVSMITKSGTNAFHGSGFWRHRNEALNANTFGNNARGIDRPEFKEHTFGGTLGGPIRKDKAFFFASYEGLRFDQGVTFLNQVPTRLEKAADFSQTKVPVRGLATPLVLYDPWSVTRVDANNYRRTPLPGNKLTRVHPGILKLLSYYPDPNRTPDTAWNTGNFLRQADRTFSRNNWNSRIDYRPSNQHFLYGSLGATRGSIATPNSWDDENPFSNSGSAREQGDNNPYVSIGDIWTLSPSAVMDVRYGINRINSRSRTPPVEGFDYTQFGIPNEFQVLNQLPGVPPNLQLNNNAYWTSLSSNTYQHKHERQTNHTFTGSLTKIIGAWTLKAGGEFRNLLSNYTDNHSSITYVADSIYSHGPNINASGGIAGAVNADQAGHAFASLLMGVGSLTNGSGQNVQGALSQKYLALYSQNDWKATRRLTLNLGLRWDLQAPPTERYNRFSGFDFDGVNPFGGRGAYVFPGSAGQSRYLWHPQYRDFGPRLGFAYRIGERMVVRGGYGLTYLPTNTGYFDGPYNYGMGPFVPTTDARVFGEAPQGVPVGNFAEVTRIVPALGSNDKAPALYGSGNPRFPWSYRNGMAQQWNLFVERRIRQDWSAAVGYSASRGTRLPTASHALQNDQFLPESLLQAWRQDYIARNGKGHAGQDQVPNPFQPNPNSLIPFSGNLGNRTMARNQTLYPYPYFLGTQPHNSIGFSNYHSLNLSLNRTFAGGLMIQTHYTWSKLLNFASSPSQNNNFNDGSGPIGGRDFRSDRLNYQISQNDIPHRFVFTYVWSLPFGTGRPFSPANRLVRALVSGWRTAGNLTLQSGLPESIGGATGALNSRAIRLEDVPIEVPKELQQWYDGATTVTLPSGRKITPCAYCFLKYNSDAFVGQTVRVADGSLQRAVLWWSPSAGFYGDVRSPGLAAWNMSVSREVRISEKIRAEFAADFQNVLNRAVFGAYTLTFGSTEVNHDPAKGILAGYGTGNAFGTHGNNTIVAPRQVEMSVKIRF